MLIPDEWKDADFTDETVIKTFNDWLEENRKEDESMQIVVPHLSHTNDGPCVLSCKTYTLRERGYPNRETIQILFSPLGKEEKRNYTSHAATEVEVLHKLFGFAIPWSKNQFKVERQKQIQELEEQINKLKNTIKELQ